ncbi:TPR-like protein [Auriscalpium vulgare]|uniref:TPR-like protein n=1 Tax=Auriscalpium vulgare TaxID=40419 RepID=A0ACB8S9Q2_9AGAM|nr:TPR-like protein [Auriscalpium vulgare]
MSIDTAALEKALLTGRWDAAPTQNPLTGLAKKVVDGAFREFLTSPLSREAFKVNFDSQDAELKEWFTFSVPSAGGELEEEIVRLLAAVACLNAFLQANWTGPDLDVQALSILTFAPPHDITDESLRQKSVSELAYGGEPAYHLAAVPFFFRVAQIILDLPFRHLQSVEWWRLRVWNVHQQILDEPVALAPGSLSSLEKLANAYASDQDLVGRLWLERGLLEHHLANDRAALEYFVRAARATELQYELTGALGKRTKFQQRDLTQLVLLAESRKRPEHEEKLPKEARDANDTASNVPETLALNDDTLLEQTEFTSSNPAAPDSLLGHLDPSAQPALHPLDQAILLSLCLNVRNTSPTHGLTNEQMSPYIARVISHPENWSVHTVALLLRARLESGRTRTVERSVLQLQALVEQMPTADSTLSERLLFIHCIPLPSKWELERELAQRFLSIGVVKSALEIFERLEMWEEAVKCWQAIERSDKALAVVHDLLEGRKAEADSVLVRGKAISGSRRVAYDASREAKLWCLLGELEPDKAVEHFKRAWSVSGATSGRAMRSLGGYYFARNEFAEAVVCLRRAVAINPLLSRSWFILGCACVREEQWEVAREAFARCVALDDEDGESWNNLASVYLRMGRIQTRKQVEDEEDESDETEVAVSGDKTPEIPFDNKMLAFRALQQGLKFSYDNWRMWMNYTIVAMDVGELSEACRGLGRVVEERAAKIGADSVDADVLDRLVNAVTRAPVDPDDAVEGDGTANAAHNPNEGHGLLRRVEDLFTRVLLPRVASPRIFRARARLLTWQGYWAEALQAHLEGYRTGIAGRMEKGETDVARWREAVQEVEDVVDVLVNFGPRVEGSKWKMQAKSILRTFMGRTRDFEDEPEWAKLVALQEELKNED